MMSFEEDIKAFIKLCDKVFPLSTAKGGFKKLNEEIKEIHSAETLIEKRDEYVDCLMVLFHCAKKEGIHPEFIIKGFSNKLSVNESRKWKYNGDGSYSHIKSS